MCVQTVINARLKELMAQLTRFKKIIVQQP